MESSDTNEQADISLVLNSDEIKSHLLEAAKWGKFLSIMGYIGIGFIVLAGIVATIGLSIAGSAAMGATGVPMGFLGVIYLVIALIYYFPVSYLYKFSTQMKQAILTDNTFTLTSGFGNLKSLFKFMGVFTIVMLSLYALIIVIAVPMAMMAGI